MAAKFAQNSILCFSFKFNIYETEQNFIIIFRRQVYYMNTLFDKHNNIFIQD